MHWKHDLAVLPRRRFLAMTGGATAAALLGGCDRIDTLLGTGQLPLSEDDRLDAFFEESFTRELERSPEWMTQLGIKRRYGEWNDWTEGGAAEAQAQTVADLERLKRDFDVERLSPASRIAWRVFAFRNERRIAAWPFRFHDYALSHFGGPHRDAPALLVNAHRIDDLSDAEAYVARIEGTEKLFADTVAWMRKSESLGITLPHFSYAIIAADAREVLKGAPLTSGGDNAIWADFKAKLAALGADAAVKSALLTRAEAALRAKLKPAYEGFIAAVDDMGSRVRSDHGVSELPNGLAFYDERLAFHTTLAMSADAIHALGLSEVERLSTEMRDLKTRTGFRGSLRSFYRDLRKNRRHYFPNTDQGRSAYMDASGALLARASAALPKAFGVLPKAACDVRRIEPYREKGTTIAFYDVGSPDGARPGHVYLNLADMTKMPKWQMAALIFHEGIPGHHLQISIAQEAEDTPDFRRYTFFTAFIEGWALYTELLAKEMDLYDGVFDDVGRVAMELWRACRLVVDTGIHAKKWSRAEAIGYFTANTPLTDDNIAREIDRYFVYPGQACAYQLGRNRILALREQAQAALGDRYDIRRFHDAVLASGAVPLPVLDEVIAEWAQAEAKPG